MVIRKTVDTTHSIRPIINVELNGVLMRALIDTGAESIVWTGDSKILVGLCESTGYKCSIKGIGGASSTYPVHHGVLILYNDDVSYKENLIVYNRAEIVRTEYSSKNFELILPYSLFMDFDISLIGNRDNKEFIIDTKIDGKYFFIPKYDSEFIVYDISAQLPSNGRFSTLSSLLH